MSAVFDIKKVLSCIGRAPNLALQGYSRAHPRSGRCLVGFGWSVVVGCAHLLGQNKGPCDAWLESELILEDELRVGEARRGVGGARAQAERSLRRRCKCRAVEGLRHAGAGYKRHGVPQDHGCC